MADDDDTITYAFDTSQVDNEKRRLDRQADYDRRQVMEWLQLSGVRSGWRVLDVGCGTGVLSKIAGDLVGPTGRVIAIDRDSNMVAAAREELAGHSNVTVEPGDYTAPPFADDSFDAVVGRFTLMYQPDPVAAVRAVARVVRPDGVVAFMEIDMAAIGEQATGYEANQWPHTPLRAKVSNWIMRAIMAGGTQPHMGLRLPTTFAEAGLIPGEDVVSVAPVTRSDPAMRVMQLRSLLPTVIAHDIATADEVDIDTLEQRLRAEDTPYSLFNPGVAIGAYAVKPPATTP